MASAMRSDLDDEMEDQFEMSLEDVSDPVVPIELLPTMSHAGASEERGSVGLRMQMEEGLTPGGYRYRTRSRTGSLRVGQGHPAANPEEGRVRLANWRLRNLSRDRGKVAPRYTMCLSRSRR